MSPVTIPIAASCATGRTLPAESRAYEQPFAARFCSMTGHGRFEVVTGPMFSGKTEALLRLAWRSRSAGESCVLVKPALDTRHASSLMISHGGGWAAARVADDEQTILQVIGSNRIVAVDEAQFFGPVLIDVAVRLRRDGRLVVAAGLDLDFRREPFGEMPRLKEAADRVLRLRAGCGACRRPCRCERCASVVQHHVARDDGSRCRADWIPRAE